MRTLLTGVALATALLVSGTAGAVNTEGYDVPYGLLGGVYEFSDSNRDSDDGVGFFGGVGFPLKSRPGEAVELTFKSLERDRDIDGRSDYQHSLFANWVRDLTPPAAYGKVKPFLLVGLGAIQEDVRGDDHIHAGLDAGLGALFPLPVRGWALRGEALAQAQLNDESVPDEDYLLDFHLRLSLQIPLDFFPRAAPPELPPAEDCPTRVVDPVTGRSDCISDSDRDGVADNLDQCPGTPTGTAVDSKGCIIAGVVIDSDDDGVLDEVDACPETPKGMIVDGTGCLIDQSVTLRAVNFESASARLTADAKTALNEVARTLKNQPNLSAQITGHTDDEGNDNFNLLLSQERAESVRQYLVGRGIAPARLVAIGMGEAEPVADNASEEGRVANRRVDFAVTVQ